MSKRDKIKQRVFQIIQIGNNSDIPSRSFDIFIVVVIFINLFVVFFETFDESAPFHTLLFVIEAITIGVFTIEYILRLWTADVAYPDMPKWKAIGKFAFSFYGAVDLLTLLPFYCPFFFPEGAIAFKILRVVRIFRLFQVNSTSDAFNVITEVLKEKSSQLLSSFVMIIILIFGASLTMYGVEHPAQPEAFPNAFSGIWWATSTILTIGYGDVYPVTLAGRFIGMLIGFLGVGLVAIPTAIISAGFVERYTRLREEALSGETKALRYVTSVVGHVHSFVGKKVSELALPPQLRIVVIVRGGNEMGVTPKTVIKQDDVLLLVSSNSEEQKGVKIYEIIIKANHEWNGMRIGDLDISRRDSIIMIMRDDRNIIPNEDTIIKEGDILIMYSQKNDDKRNVLDVH